MKTKNNGYNQAGICPGISNWMKGYDDAAVLDKPKNPNDSSYMDGWTYRKDNPKA